MLSHNSARLTSLVRFGSNVRMNINIPYNKANHIMTSGWIRYMLRHKYLRIAKVITVYLFIFFIQKENRNGYDRVFNSKYLFFPHWNLGPFRKSFNQNLMPTFIIFLMFLMKRNKYKIVFFFFFRGNKWNFNWLYLTW